MKLPPPEQLAIAIGWLRVNEGDEGEADACKAVAAWLVKAGYEQMLREEARRGGVPIGQLRDRIAALKDAE